VKWLLDTNVVSETIRRRPDAAVMNWIAKASTTDTRTSVVVIAEIVEGISRTSNEVRRRELTHWLDTTIADWLSDQALPITLDILTDWLALNRRLAARRLARKAADTLIAATARVYGLTVVTRNVRDFADTGVVVYDPWHDKTHRMVEP
jgi:predicted nucleic acid-binding protein